MKSMYHVLYRYENSFFFSNEARGDNQDPHVEGAKSVAFLVNLYPALACK